MNFEQYVSQYNTNSVEDHIAYSVNKKVGEAKISDFVAIVDAEMDLLALVPPKLANEFVNLLNSIKLK